MKWLLLFFVLLLAVGLLFYKVLSNTARDISSTSPFQQWIGKSYVTSSPLLITLNGPADEKLATHTLSNQLVPDTAKEKLVPIGTKITFSKAVELKKGVSGSVYHFLLGEIYEKESQPVQFQMYWGKQKDILDAKSPWIYPAPLLE